MQPILRFEGQFFLVVLCFVCVTPFFGQFSCPTDDLSQVCSHAFWLGIYGLDLEHSKMARPEDGTACNIDRIARNTDLAASYLINDTVEMYGRHVGCSKYQLVFILKNVRRVFDTEKSASRAISAETLSCG